MDKIYFKKVKDPYGWMSNMSPHPVTYKDEVFPTAEHLFQYLRFEDGALAKSIIDIKSPMAAKMYAKALMKCTPLLYAPRSEDDLVSMLFVLLLKLKCNPDLIHSLLETGDREIVEDVSSRPNESGLFWGATKDGRGQNKLGKMWVAVRDDIRKSVIDLDPL